MHLSSVYLCLFFRNPVLTPGGFCHAGLATNAIQTQKVLRQAGVHIDIFGVPQPEDILTTLRGMAVPPTHVVIEAIWVETAALKQIISEFGSTKFLVRTHSQVGFLQVEPPAVKILREMLVLQNSLGGLVSGNNRRIVHFIEKAYGSKCVYLPNLYHLEHLHAHQPTPGVLRIASFGALRLLKNHMTAAAAALIIGKHENAKLEFWVSVHREENAGAKGILQAIRNLYANLPWATLVEHPWEDWDKFRKTIGKMDLYVQPSYTETFNITVADAIAEGVPCVVSDAIDWTPQSWQAGADNAEAIAHVGIGHLHNPAAPGEGLDHLRRHVQEGTQTWIRYLTR